MGNDGMTLAQVLGWSVAAVSAAAVLNFLLKQISREYLKTRSAGNPEFARAYRSFMQVMVRNHRYFGMAAAVLLPVHAGAVLLSGVTSLTGAAAGVLLLSTAGTGLHGLYVVKNPRGGWIHLHRSAAFLLTLAVILHVFVKAYVFL